MPHSPLLQTLHAPIDIAIVQILLSLLPSDCSAAQMSVILNPIEFPSEEMAIEFRCKEGGGEELMPTDELFTKLYEHLEVFRKHGAPWKSLTYDINCDCGSKSWKYSVDYTYE